MHTSQTFEIFWTNYEKHSFYWRLGMVADNREWAVFMESWGANNLSNAFRAILSNNN